MSRVDQSHPDFVRGELIARIRELEKRAGPRAIREALLAVMGPDGAERDRLKQLDDEIAELRKQLT